MESTKFIWQDGEFVPWEQATTHVLTHTLHYGGGVFEGIRAYKSDRGPAVFRLTAHIERLFYSASVIDLKIPYSIEEVIAATTELIAKNELEECYIRPFAFFGYGKMGINPKGAPSRLVIACWPWGAYLPHEMVDLKTSTFFRVHPQSTFMDAKICGNYINSILAVQELEGSKYHEALLLDYQGNVAEGPGENLFIAKDDQLFTPPLGTILPGITRDTIFQLAAENDIVVQEANLLPEDVYQADEAFFTGTAAEVSPIRSVDDHVLGAGSIGPYTKMLKQSYFDTVKGKKKSFEHFLTLVNKQSAG